MRNVWRLCLSLLFLFASVTAVAQGTGSITGIVRDNTGAVVPSAQVTLLNTAQGTQLTTNTNESGEYLFAAVPPGNYSLEVTAAGFNRFVSQGIVLRVAEKQRLDAELAVGDVKTAVNVEATATHVETESAELSGIVTGKQMSQIVLNGRNFSQLVVLTPGVVSQTNQDEGTVGVNGRIDYAVNGGRAIYNNWEIDGGDNMDNGSNGTLNVYPSVDAIAEVKILTSNYGAQYGRNGSGTIQTVTKSGGQQFHGSAYEFTRNNFFNARNFFDDKTQTYIKNDWGYTIGGPVWIPKLYNRNKEKTFFFFSEEWRKDRVPGSTFDRQVPSSQERQGIFNDVCPAYSATNPNFVLKSYPDCPAMPGTRNLTAGTGMAYPNNAVAVDPNAVAIMAMVPAPTTDAGAQSRFTGARTLPTNWREELVRVDHNFTDTTRFFFRYIHDSWNQVVTPSLWSGSNFPTVGTNFVGPGVSMVAHLAHNVDPTLLNEFTFSYTTDHIFLTPFGTWQRPASMTMTGFFNNGFGGKLPAVSINNGAAYGGGFQADVAGWPWNNANPTYTFRDQIAKIWGSHNIYAGFYYAAQQKNENNGAETQGFLNFSNSSDVTTGNAWADFLLGRVSSFNQNNMQTKYYYRSRTFEPYVQDDWHITPRLTVNLGFRASFFGSYNERYSNFYNFYPSLYNPANAARIDVTGKVTGHQGLIIPGSGNPYEGMQACYNCSNAKLFNPAPRVGFAWDPFGNGKWAVRGGYGIFFEHLNGNEVISGLEGNPPGILNPTQYNAVGYTSLGAGGLIGTTGMGIYPKNTVWPYMQQWHFDVQHDLMANTVVSASYVGSKGTHLIWQRDINQLFPTAPSANPFQPGQPLTDAICGTIQNAWLPNVSAVVNGKTITGSTAQNIAVACGKSADPYRIYQGYNNLRLNEAGANSIYNALQTSFRRTGARSQFTASYTWSHSIDDASVQGCDGCVDAYNMRLKRASSDFDVRHLITAGYVIDLPYFNDKPAFVKYTAGGWQWSGLWKFNTGTPFNVTAGNGNGLLPGGGVGGIGSTYPDLIGDPHSTPAVKDTVNVKGPLLFNPAAFAAPTGLTFGTFGRNVLNLPNRDNVDMGMFKTFNIRERARFEFRAEAFNVFNHTQFSLMNSGISCYGGSNNSAGETGCITSKNFLHPSQAHLPRILQFGMKFVF